MSDFFERLLGTQSLPSPPGVALEIIRMNQDDDLEIADLAAVIARDPALAAKLLKAANSSQMGRPGQVADIEDAIMVLGLRSVNLLALSFSLTGSIATSESQGFDYSRFWIQSAVNTVAARAIATRCVKSRRDEAFLAGLLCDFGQLLLAEVAPDEYAPVLERERETGQPIHLVEAVELGSDHAEIGSRILAEWGLPDLITAAIGAHHDPSRIDGRDRDRLSLARVLHLASACGSFFLSGSADQGDSVLSLAQSYFELTPEQAQELIDELREGVPELLEILELKSVEPDQINRLRGQASELLVRESLELNQRVQAISSTVERLTEQNTKLEQRARTDPLTGLNNRFFLEENLEQELQRAARSNSGVGLLIIDVDHFKSVNDFHGHQAGDMVLRKLASLIEARLSFGQSAIRCGGDEFIVLCTDVNEEALLERARLLRRAAEETSVSWDDHEIKVTLSIGGALVHGAAATGASTALLRTADQELYKAKSKGRNRVFVTTIPEGGA